MIEKLKNLGWKQFGGLVLIVIIIIAFGFGGFGGGFSTNNQNNIAKINKTNVTTQDFIDYINLSGVSREAIRNNLDNNIIDELLSGLISTTLIDLEIEDYKISINKGTILKYVRENKQFKDENGAFQRIKYEKFLLSNNMSAPLFELKLKNQGLQKHLFDFIGAGTITPEFLTKSRFEDNNKSLIVEYFDMENLYKFKENYTSSEMKIFIEENKDLLKREYIDFKYVVLNPQNLIGIDEFTQDFFNEIDEIENQISQSESFNSIIENINVDVIRVDEFIPNAKTNSNEELIYSKKTNKLDIIESGDNYILYNIENEYDRLPDLNDEIIKDQIVELIYQKDKFDYNRKIIEEIQNDEFNENKFTELSSGKILSGSINSINDYNLFEKNSINMLYSLPQNSFNLVNNSNNQIFLVKIKEINKNIVNKKSEEYKDFVNLQNTNNRKSILQSYDVLLNNKYQVELNQKTIDRVKNYFK